MLGGHYLRPTSVLDAPNLAQVVNRIQSRPHWMVGEAIAVEPDLFEAAKEEMIELMSERGFPVWAAKMDRPNFMLCGVAVVMLDA